MALCAIRGIYLRMVIFKQINDDYFPITAPHKEFYAFLFIL